MPVIESYPPVCFVQHPHAKRVAYFAWQIVRRSYTARYRELVYSSNPNATKLYPAEVMPFLPVLPGHHFIVDMMLIGFLGHRMCDCITCGEANFDYEPIVSKGFQ